jgi:predicted HD phosphohydrolase
MADRDGPRDRSVDLRHEARGAAYLATLFPPSVTAPIALHVRAKRYLVTTDPSYAAALSPGSVASLARQGGALDPSEVAAFESNPGWADAVRLRRWDDQGKVDGLDVPGLGSYRALLESLQR